MRFSARRDKNVRFSAILCKLILRISAIVVSLHNVIVGDSKKSTGTQPSCRGGYLLNECRFREHKSLTLQIKTSWYDTGREMVDKI